MQTSKVCGGFKTLQWCESITSRHFDWLGVRVNYCVGLESRWGFIALRGFESHSNRHFWIGAGIGNLLRLESEWLGESSHGRSGLPLSAILGCWASGLRRRTVDPVFHGFESRTPRHLARRFCDSVTNFLTLVRNKTIANKGSIPARRLVEYRFNFSRCDWNGIQRGLKILRP